MASTSSPANIDTILDAIETLSKLLSAFPPNKAALNKPLITQRASHLVSQLTAICNGIGDQADAARASSSGPPTPAKQSPMPPQSKTEPSTDAQPEKPISPSTSNSLKRQSSSPPPTPPQNKKVRSSPPDLSVPVPEPSPVNPISNSLASLFAERGARLESQQRQRKAEAQQEARVKVKARQEAIAADPTKAEQRKHAEEMKKAMSKEKTQKELIRRRIEEDRKERKERVEQERLRREALAVDGAVPAAKRVEIVKGEIRVVEGKKKKMKKETKKTVMTTLGNDDDDDDERDENYVEGDEEGDEDSDDDE